MKIFIVTLKIIGMSLLLFVISVFAQNLGILWHIFDLYTIEYVLHGLTYLAIATWFIKILVNKGLKKPLSYYRITSIQIYPLCLILGFFLPLTVMLVYYIFVPGNLIMPNYKSSKEYVEMLIDGILIAGIVAPIVEEIVFRGVLLKYIEEKTNIIFAVIVTSILFGVVHLFNGELVGMDRYLLIIAGTFAGIMYATATYVYNSIWASILLHVFWNLWGLYIISNSKIDYGIFQYVINSNNIFITGGDYGMDSSLISISGYILITVILLSKKISRMIKVK